MTHLSWLFAILYLLTVTLQTSLATDTAVEAVDPVEKPSEKLTPSFQSKVSFSGLKLQGQLKKPDLSYIYKRRGLKAEQIVNIPEDFNEEIVQGSGKF